jgi:hypothetical protein
MSTSPASTCHFTIDTSENCAAWDAVVRSDSYFAPAVTYGDNNNVDDAVACVTHASRVRARIGGDQIFVDARIALVGWILREVGNERRLQRVTIEEHQVGDLVFVLLPLFIHVTEDHIDLRIVQHDAT